MNLSFCLACFEKQRTIDRLEEENRRLKQQLRYRQEKEKQGFFGSATSSAKQPLKANSPAEQQSQRGGAQQGHPGQGRQTIEEAQAARVLDVPLESTCPHCGGPLQDKGFRSRSVLEIPPPRPEPVVYRLQKRWCPHCQKAFQSSAPAVLPKALFGNQLTTQILSLHYLHGIPLGRISQQMALEIGSLIALLHRLAGLFRPVVPLLIEQYAQAPVRQADETGWRTDGHSGYVWLFCTPHLSLFLFRNTRSASVPREVLGDQPRAGYLVVDRYNGYNRVACRLQYCYAHLLREVEDLAKEFPDQAEVAAFTATLIPLLASAMRLGHPPLSEDQYYQQAAEIKLQILTVTQQPAQHLGIRRIQDIFRHHPDRLYHWADNRLVPAHNNRSERELRPTVIARKVSFGSQSEEGAKTREVLMTVLHTLKKRHPCPEEHLKRVLDQLAANIQQNSFPLLFPSDSS